MTSAPDPVSRPTDYSAGSTSPGSGSYDSYAQSAPQGGYDPNAYNQGAYPQGGYDPSGYAQSVPQGGYDPNAYYQGAYPAPAAVFAQKSKVAAGLLGIFLGVLGIHNFYLGYTGKAVAQLLITVLSLGFLSFISAVWGLVEGILILCAQPGSQPWGVDANNVPLSS